MSVSKHEALGFSDLDLDEKSSQPEMRISADKYTLCPITSLPSSSDNKIQTPQRGCIYIDSVNEEYIARIYDEEMRGGYESVVILGPSIWFDENAKKEIKKLYLVEETGNIFLYHYDGTQWCRISRERAAAIEAIGIFDGEQGEYNQPGIIEIVTSFYGSRLLKGKLKGLNLKDLTALNLKEQIIKQMLVGEHIPEQMLPVVHVPAEAAGPREKKRQRATEAADSKPPRKMAAKRNLRFDFEKTAANTDGKSLTAGDTEQTALPPSINGIIEFSDQYLGILQPKNASSSPNNSGALCTARVSSGLGSPTNYNCTFWGTSLGKLGSNVEKSTADSLLENGQEETNSTLAALIARVQDGNGTQDDYSAYASLLLIGSKEVEQNIELAGYFLGLADQLPGANENTGLQVSSEVNENICSLISAANEEMDILGGPNPFVLDDDLVALDDDPGFENDSTLSPSFSF